MELCWLLLGRQRQVILTSSKRPSRRDRSASALNPVALSPHMSRNCSTLHQLTPAELPGSRQGGGNSGEQQNHTGSTTTLRIPQMSLATTCHESSGQKRESMQRWSLADSAQCECGDPQQAVDHVLTSCPKPPNGDVGLMNLDDETLEWLATTELRI